LAWQRDGFPEEPMARRMGAGLLLGVWMLAATAWAQPAAEVTANARLIIPAEGPTTVPAASAPDLAPADAPVVASQPSAALAAAAVPSPSETDGRPIRRSSTDERPLDPTPSTGDGGAWWRTLGALALVVVLIFLARRVLARFAGGRTGGGASGVVEVLSRTPVGSRQSVMLLRVGPRVLVVGAGGETMNTLTEIDDPEQVSQLLGAVERARAGSLTNAFAGALKREQVVWDDGADDAGARTTSPLSGAVDQMKAMLGRLRGGPPAGGAR